MTNQAVLDILYRQSAAIEALAALLRGESKDRDREYERSERWHDDLTRTLADIRRDIDLISRPIKEQTAELVVSGIPAKKLFPLLKWVLAGAAGAAAHFLSQLFLHH